MEGKNGRNCRQERSLKWSMCVGDVFMQIDVSQSWRRLWMGGKGDTVCMSMFVQALPCMTVNTCFPFLTICSHLSLFHGVMSTKA